MDAIQIGLVALVLFALAGLFTVTQQTSAVVERFGRFKKLCGPGLNWRIPFIDRIAARISLRIEQLDVDVETKTRDNVFVMTKVSVQFQVLPDNVVSAFYQLNDPRRQITSYVFDLVRAEIPKLSLDEVFERKDDVATAVKSELSSVMADFGYGIVKALVTDINPDETVKASMNAINAAQRERVAAEERGEADKILVVKQAEAEAASKKLQGHGIADQRSAIVDGLRESVLEFQQGVPGTDAHDVMSLVLITQYFDMLKDLGDNSRTNTIFVDHSPAGMSSVRDQVMQAMTAGNPADTGEPVVAEEPRRVA